MPPNERKELIDRVVRKALQEWRSRPDQEIPSNAEMAHRIGHSLFQKFQKGSFGAVKKKSDDMKS